MAEALWLQQAGVDYSAAEDRRAISALSAPGVVNGLVIAPSTGLNVTVSAGTAIIDDGAGGCYVAYTTGTSTLLLPGPATTNIYIVVNTSTAEVTVTSGLTPTAGTYLTLGSAVTVSPGIVQSVTQSAPAAEPRAMVGKYLPKTGGTVSGEVNASRLVVPGLFGVGGADLSPNAPNGIRLGGTNPTARHYLHVTAKAPAGGLNQINRSLSGQPAVWEGIHWTPPSSGNNVTDYTQIPMGSSDYAIFPGVAGYYLLSGYGTFAANPGGTRQLRVSVWNQNGAAADTYSYANYSSEFQPTANAAVTLNFTAMLVMGPGQYARVEAYQNSDAVLDFTGARLMMRLIQAN